MDRSQILKQPSYWTTKIQLDLYNCAEQFMHENNMNRSQLAQHLGVSKGYVSQLLNGDYDHKLSKLVELSIDFGMVPQITFKPIDTALEDDKAEEFNLNWKQFQYEDSSDSIFEVTGKLNNRYEYSNSKTEKAA